jgi:hypothetical protein
MSHPTVRFEEHPPTAYQHINNGPPQRSLHQHTMSAPSVSARENKRHGWYNGPVVHRDGAQQPQDGRNAHVDRLVHPNFQAFNGFPARNQQPQQPQQQQDNHANSTDPLGRLEALVAVATSESSTATAC